MTGSHMQSPRECSLTFYPFYFLCVQKEHNKRPSRKYEKYFFFLGTSRCNHTCTYSILIHHRIGPITQSHCISSSLSYNEFILRYKRRCIFCSIHHRLYSVFTNTNFIVFP